MIHKWVFPGLIANDRALVRKRVSCCRSNLNPVSCKDFSGFSRGSGQVNSLLRVPFFYLLGMCQSLLIKRWITRRLFALNAEDLLTLLRDQIKSCRVLAHLSSGSEELWSYNLAVMWFTFLRFWTVHSEELPVYYLLPGNHLNLSEKESSNSLCLFSPLTIMVKYIVW